MQAVHRQLRFCRHAAVHKHVYTRSRTQSLRCRSAAPATTVSIDWNEVYFGSQLPQRYVGPVEVQEIPGKGRGLVATRDIAAGELLLVSQPVVYLEGEAEGAIPDVKQLLDKLNAGQYTEQQLAWLKSMHTGDESVSPAVPDMATDSSPATDAATPQRAISNTDVHEASRITLLALNMFGEAFQDLPASLVRGDNPAGHLGLWPEFSLLNHSCAPNSINYTVGNRMIVRAGKAVPKGTELCINYLGRGSLRPASERLMDLHEYGFACCCPRCTAELDTSHESAVSAVHDLHNAVMLDLVPTLQTVLGDAVQPGDAKATAAVAQAHERLLPMLTSLDQQLTAVADVQQNSHNIAAGGPQLADWLRASSFEAYALHSQLKDIQEQLQASDSGSADTSVAKTVQAEDGSHDQRMLEVASNVATASDLHLFLAVKQLSRAQQTYGPESEIAMKLQEHALHVLALRYGQGLSDEIIAQLLHASALSLERVAL